MKTQLTAGFALLACAMFAEADLATLTDSKKKDQHITTSADAVQNTKKQPDWETTDPDFKGESPEEKANRLANGLPEHAGSIPASYLKINYYNPKLFVGIQGDPTISYGFMVPIWQRDNRVLLTQVSQQVDDFLTNSSIDIAYRQMNDNQSAMWGVYSGFDLQRTKKDNHFKHVSVGAEFRTARWHTYSNVYIPVSKPVTESDYHQWQLQPTTDGSGFHNVLQKQGEEKAMLGVDASVGYTFLPKYNARFYLGGYHYQAKDVKTINGPRAVLELDLYNSVQNGSRQSFLERITFQGVAQYDKINYGDMYAGVTFVFNIGHKKNLTGMQQYMMYQLPRQYGTEIRPNDNAPLTLYRKANGNPLTIAQVTNEAQFDNAITNNADVIAVQGSITDLDTKILNADQDLTGGQYTLGNGVTLDVGSSGALTAATGQDLIQVTRNNLIENITLNADLANNVIVNDLSSSIGTVTINNVTANTGINFLINDAGTDTNLTVKNSRFINTDDVSNKNMLFVRLNSGEGEFTFNDNTVTVGNGNLNNGIYVSIGPDGGTTATATVHSIDGNTITMGRGNNNNGIQVETVPVNATENIANLTINSISNNTIAINSVSGNVGNSGIFVEAVNSFTTQSNITINKVQGNNITIADGSQSSGLYFLLTSFAENGSLTVNNIINNTVNFTSGSQMRGVYASVGGTTGTLSLNTVYGNNLSSPSGGVNNYGFLFEADSGMNLNVDVNRNGLSLTEANTFAGISKIGSGTITILPEE